MAEPNARDEQMAAAVYRVHRDQMPAVVAAYREEIEAPLKARLAELEELHCTDPHADEVAHDAIRERDALKAEVERLEDKVLHMAMTQDAVHAIEVERLRAEVERLRAANAETCQVAEDRIGALEAEVERLKSEKRGACVERWRETQRANAAEAEIERFRRDGCIVYASDQSSRAEMSRLRAQIAEWKAKYEFMVARAADEKLDGYRELGERAAAAESRAANAEAAHALADAVKALLQSADASWEEMEQGHDWHEACKLARQAVADYERRKGGE